MCMCMPCWLALKSHEGEGQGASWARPAAMARQPPLLPDRARGSSGACSLRVQAEQADLEAIATKWGHLAHNVALQ